MKDLVLFAASFYLLKQDLIRALLSPKQLVAGLLIVEIKSVRDETTYARYREQVSPNLAAAGARYLVRGREVQVLEGDWQPGRVVVVRFDSVQAARDWWNSRAYATLKAIRQRSTDTNMLLVEGVANE